MTTRQDLIKRALSDADTFVSAQDLHAGLRSKGHRVGLATVYRALHGLAEAGVADRLRDKDGRHVYRTCRNPGHHHYLRCQACGAAADVPASALEQWAAAVGSKYGFTDVTVTAELFGTCADCSIAGQRRGARRDLRGAGRAADDRAGAAGAAAVDARCRLPVGSPQGGPAVVRPVRLGA